jgi:uncharacterized protein YjbJ (UPF0337 family)
MGSTSDKYTGKAKKAAGKATNDKPLEARGKAQEEKGKLKGMFK